MGEDLSTVLIIFAVLADGNIQEESWYLGTDPNSGVGGLNRHSTVEADISPNRYDGSLLSYSTSLTTFQGGLLQRLRRQSPPLQPHVRPQHPLRQSIAVQAVLYPGNGQALRVASQLRQEV